MDYNYICVIGGSNMDISATSYMAIKEEDSNPGKVVLSPGGVGRNIAENLSKLGAKVNLLSVFGTKDPYSDVIISNCNDVGIETNNSLFSDNISVGLYICINKPNGDMYVSVSAMDSINKLDENYLNSKIDFINNSSIVVIDANLSENALNFLAKHCVRPIMCDVVSVTKSEKIKKILPSIHLLKANKLEAESLTGININDLESLKLSGEKLLNMGAKNIIITLGKDGAYYQNKEKYGLIKNMPINVVNTTGCGDAFMSAAIFRSLETDDIMKWTSYGTVCAGLTASHDGAVLPHLSKEMIDRHINEIEVIL